jgi:SAM-dependent methyltransferase
MRAVPSRVRARVTALELGRGGRFWDRLRGRRLCPRLVSLRLDPSLSHRRIDQELDRIFRVIVGRRLTVYVVGPHRRRHSLSDFVESGAVQAPRLLPYVRSDECVLEYGGGVGRLGRVVLPHVRRLVSVDVEPLMKEYGRRISPGVEFYHLDELAESRQFDGAYSVAVFFHLTLEQQKRALEYVHRRLKPGGWFLVDLKIGPRTTDRRPPEYWGYTALADFRALYEPLFTAQTVPLFNSGFLMRKREETHGTG